MIPVTSTGERVSVWKRTLAEHYQRLKEPESEIGEALTPDQLKRLESAAAGKDAWEVVYCAELLATNAGFRGAEIKKMRLGAIDLRSGACALRESLQRATRVHAGSSSIERLWLLSTDCIDGHNNSALTIRSIIYFQPI